MYLFMDKDDKLFSIKMNCYCRARNLIYMLKKILIYSSFLLLFLVLSSFTSHIVSSPLNFNFLNSFPNSSYTSNELSPPSKSIFFHETFAKGVLNSRQACAVESAARTHPDFQINVLFLGTFQEKNMDNECLKALKTYSNVKFFSISLLEYSQGTPLESMVRDGALNKSKWQASHTSDALRYLSLYKWGGVYLDLDVVVAKPFNNLTSNWGARESKTAVAAGAMSFSRDKLGREVADLAIKDFKTNFNGNLWSQNGPGVMTRILKNMCKTKKPIEMSAKRCKGFEVYGPELFYPVSWKHAKDYFGTKKLKVQQPYIYHVWNKLTYKKKVGKTSVYAKLANEYCPEIYKAYGDSFGI